MMASLVSIDGHFSDCLRDELRREQLAVEAAPLLMELIHSTPTITLYGELLRRWYRVVSSIQPGTDRALASVSPEMGWLETDLADLGLIPTARWSDSPDFTPSESLGYRFAIESQHLRSRVLLPVLRHELGDQTDAFAFFGAHGNQTGSWRSVISKIDSVDPASRREVLVGARATLVALDRALSD
jgi:heme oxygenase